MILRVLCSLAGGHEWVSWSSDNGKLNGIQCEFCGVLKIYPSDHKESK